METQELASARLFDALRRLEALERRHRRWRLAAVALVAIIGGIAAGSVPSDRRATGPSSDPMAA